MFRTLTVSSTIVLPSLEWIAILLPIETSANWSTKISSVIPPFVVWAVIVAARPIVSEEIPALWFPFRFEIDVVKPLIRIFSLLLTSNPFSKYADTWNWLSLTKTELAYWSKSVSIVVISLPTSSDTSTDNPDPPVSVSSKLTLSPTL